MELACQRGQHSVDEVGQVDQVISGSLGFTLISFFQEGYYVFEATGLAKTIEVVRDALEIVE